MIKEKHRFYHLKRLMRLDFSQEKAVSCHKSKLLSDPTGKRSHWRDEKLRPQKRVTLRPAGLVSKSLRAGGGLSGGKNWWLGVQARTQEGSWFVRTRFWSYDWGYILGSVGPWDFFLLCSSWLSILLNQNPSNLLFCGLLLICKRSLCFRRNAAQLNLAWLY